MTRLVAVALLAGSAPRRAADGELRAAGGNSAGRTLPRAAFSAVLPSGRLVTPAGTSVVTGMERCGVALTPDGRYAIATNDDERGAPRAARSTPMRAAAIR